MRTIRLDDRLLLLVEYVCNTGHAHVIPVLIERVDGWDLGDYVESVRAVAPNATAVTFA